MVIDPPEGLFLDVTGCAHLFGDEAKLRAEIVTRLHAQGFGARAAIAPTPGAAWAFARYGQKQPAPKQNLRSQLEVSLATESEDLLGLGELPIEALRLDAAAAALMRAAQACSAPSMVPGPATAKAPWARLREAHGGAG